MKLLYKLLRVKQYSKNIFVVAALLFTRDFVHTDKVLLTLEAIAVMCLIGSATYIANDIVDLERDRAHPVKRNRPIASGAVSVPIAWAVAVVCLIAGLALAYSIRIQVVYCALFYLGMQAVYNAKLK